MAETLPTFNPEDPVRLLSDRSQVGTVAAPGTRSYGEWFYKVKLATGSSITCPESDLESFVAEVSPEELFVRGSFGDHEDLLRMITFRKLDSPVENTIHSMGTTRIEFTVPPTCWTEGSKAQVARDRPLRQNPRWLGCVLRDLGQPASSAT